MPRDSRGRSGRAMNKYARRSPVREPRRALLIVCEGAETEPGYFESFRRELRLSSIAVRPGTGGGIAGTVDRAVRCVEMERRDGAAPFDETWCVFDTEGLGEGSQLSQAIDRARRAGINLAISNPSFEFWYLLHFEDTDRPFADASEVTRYLKRHIPDYHKSLSVFSMVRPTTNVAIGRALTLQTRLASAGDPHPNPSTTVYLLVQELTDLSSRH